MTGPSPRLLTKRAAAAYCSISVPVFDRLQPARAIELQQGHKRLNRYDVADLDRWIETLKGSPRDETEDWLNRLGGTSSDDHPDARH